MEDRGLEDLTTACACSQEVERFIFNKYALRRWAQPGAEWPPPPPYSAAAGADVITTSVFDLQQWDAAAAAPAAATQSTTGGGAATGTTQKGVGVQPGGKEGGAAGGGHAWARQSDAQSGADVADAAQLLGPKGTNAAAGSEAVGCRAVVEFEGVVLGQEVLAIATGMVSQTQGMRRLPASVVAAGVAGSAYDSVFVICLESVCAAPTGVRADATCIPHFFLGLYPCPTRCFCILAPHNFPLVHPQTLW
eukprot:1148988-Pelagomonas_calceolata.AAC.5